MGKEIYNVDTMLSSKSEHSPVSLQYEVRVPFWASILNRGKNGFLNDLLVEFMSPSSFHQIFCSRKLPHYILGAYSVQGLPTLTRVGLRQTQYECYSRFSQEIPGTSVRISFYLNRRYAFPSKSFSQCIQRQWVSVNSTNITNEGYCPHCQQASLWFFFSVINFLIQSLRLPLLFKLKHAIPFDTNMKVSSTNRIDQLAKRAAPQIMHEASVSSHLYEWYTTNSNAINIFDSLFFFFQN